MEKAISETLTINKEDTMKKKILTALKIALYCLLAVSVVIWIRAVILSCIEVSSYHSFSLTVRFAFNALISYVALPAAFADMLYCVRYFESDKKTIIKTVANCLFILLSVGMIEDMFKSFLSPYKDGSSLVVYYLIARGVYAAACAITSRVSRSIEASSENQTKSKRIVLILAITSLVFHVSTIAIPLGPWRAYWVITLPIAGAFISVCSYLIGKTVSEKRKNLKFFAWFLGISASQLFITLCFLGKRFNPGAVVMWISLSFAMFIWCIVGIAVKKSHECRADEAVDGAVKNKKLKTKTAITVIACILIYATIVIAVPIMYLGDMFSRVYNDDVIIRSPDGEYTLIIKEWEGFESCGTEIYGIKGTSPNWIEKLLPEKLGKLTLGYQPFKEGKYEIEWAEDEIIIQYGSKYLKLYLDYPDNTSIYLNFTALVAAIVAVITALTLLIVKKVRKRKKMIA